MKPYKRPAVVTMVCDPEPDAKNVSLEAIAIVDKPVDKPVDNYARG